MKNWPCIRCFPSVVKSEKGPSVCGCSSWSSEPEKSDTIHLIQLRVQRMIDEDLGKPWENTMELWKDPPFFIGKSTISICAMASIANC